MTLIPSLVFSTRSPHPQSGSDFVREIVAESAGIGDEVRAEFGRRADIAGSILQHEFSSPVYMFSPLNRESWLLCRAVSLGLYRKGSNQLLIHGVVLAEEHLEALGGNPLLLDRQDVRHECGLSFVDRHPRTERRLSALPFDARVAGRCRELNREHLEKLDRSIRNDWLASAYDALADGQRVGLATNSHVPSLAEALLLHFHPDDRMELSFHTFYSHSRPLDYRLLVLAPEDMSMVRGQFRDLRLLDLTAPSPEIATEGLGGRAVRLRRGSIDAFLRTVQAHRLTYWSCRILPPLTGKDADICLRDGLGEPLTAAERRRLQELEGRGESGLRYKVTSLARTWREQPREFPERLAEVADTKSRVALKELLDFLETPPVGWDERWCLLTLLLHEEGFQPGEEWRAERQRAWRLLMPAGQFKEFLGTLSSEQARWAEPLLLAYVLDKLEPVGYTLPVPPYWETLVEWLGRRGRLGALLGGIEEALPRIVGEAASSAWERLQRLLSEAALPGEALRIFFQRHRPLLSAAEAAAATREALQWWLVQGSEQDAKVAPLLTQLDIAEQALPLLGAWLAEQPSGARERAFHRLADILARVKRLPPAAGPACGRLLAHLAPSPAGGKVPAVFDKCLRVLADDEDGVPERFASAAVGEATAMLLPLLDAPCHRRDLAARIQAAAVLLEARNRHSATALVDAGLLDLAVRACILAEEAMVWGLGKDTVPQLRNSWEAFLRRTSVTDLLEPQEAAVSPSLWHQVGEWLELLEDEITMHPYPRAEDDPRFQLFIRLAWWRWCAGENQVEKAAVCAKIRLTATWGKIRAPVEWLRLRMEELVPDRLQATARATLPSRPEPRRLYLKLPEMLGGLGGRR